MANEFKKITEAFPHLESNERLKAMAQELDKLKVLRDFVYSEAGEVVINRHRLAATSSLKKLIAGYKEMSRDELVSHLSEFKAAFDFVLEFREVDENMKDAQKMIDDEVGSLVN